MLLSAIPLVDDPLGLAFAAGDALRLHQGYSQVSTPAALRMTSMMTQKSEPTIAKNQRLGMPSILVSLLGRSILHQISPLRANMKHISILRPESSKKAVLPGAPQTGA